MSSDQPSKKQKTTADTMVQVGDKIPPVVIDYGFGDDQEKVRPLPDLLCAPALAPCALCAYSLPSPWKENVPRNNSHPRRLAPRAARCHPRWIRPCGRPARVRSSVTSDVDTPTTYVSQVPSLSHSTHSAADSTPRLASALTVSSSSPPPAWPPPLVATPATPSG